MFTVTLKNDFKKFIYVRGLRMVKKDTKKSKNESIDRDGFGPSTVQDEVVLEL